MNSEVFEPIVSLCFFLVNVHIVYFNNAHGQCIFKSIPCSIFMTPIGFSKKGLGGLIVSSEVFAALSKL